MPIGRAIWLAIGGLSLGVGIIGIVTPLLPTVPLVLLAAYCFAQSSPKLHDWLLEHDRFGPMIRDWRENGAISRRAKIYATLSVFAAFLISVFLRVPNLLLGIQALVLSMVLVFIWTRPD